MGGGFCILLTWIQLLLATFFLLFMIIQFGQSFSCWKDCLIFGGAYDAFYGRMVPRSCGCKISPNSLPPTNLFDSFYKMLVILCCLFLTEPGSVQYSQASLTFLSFSHCFGSFIFIFSKSKMCCNILFRAKRLSPGNPFHTSHLLVHSLSNNLVMNHSI